MFIITCLIRFIEKVFVLSVLSVLIVKCGVNSTKKTSNAAYYWQQNFSLSNYELSFLNNNKVNTLYIKFFDLDTKGDSNQVIPIAVLNVSEPFPEIIKEVIPVVFITNRCLLNKTEIEIDSLAKKIVRKSFALANKNKIIFKQLQIDCDWSQKTKTNYFFLLKKIKKYSAKTVSCTVRLHQIKYYKNTGVPPVDRGMLMYYNIGDLKNKNEENSIHNYNIGKNYTQKLREYPLALDVVLPIFSWAVKYRNNKFIGIWNEASLQQLSNTNLFKKTGNNTYKVKKNIENSYLYAGDELRWEEVKINEMIKTCKWIQKNSATDSFSVSVFHVKEDKLKHYDQKELANIYNSFR